MPEEFYLALRSRSARRSAKTYEKWSFLGVFSCLNHFPQFSGQVKEWFLLKLNEMIRISHVVECPIVFVLLCNLGWQGGVLKLMKNAQLWIFLTVWELSSKFLGRWRSGMRIAWNGKSVTWSCVPNYFYFVLWLRWGGRGFQSYQKWSFFSVLAVWIFFPKVLGRLSSSLC